MYSQAVDKNNPKGKTRFFESYKDPSTGRFKTISVTLDKNTAQSRKIALTRLHARIQAILSEQCPANCNSITLSEIIARYNHDQERDGNIRESTWRRNHRQLAACEKILGSEVLLNNLTARYVNEKFRDTGESNIRINERIVRLKAMLRWANQEGYLNDIAWLSGIKTYPKTESKEKLMSKFMESSELKLLLESMTVEHWKLATSMLCLSGLRIGEFISLNDSDVTDTEIIVNKTYYVEKHRVEYTTKTANSNRRVFIQPELRTVISEIRQYVSAQDLATEIFFPNSNGGYMHYESYRKYLGETSEKVLGRRLTPHALRHTHTSLLAEKGVPLPVISRRLGHGDSEITEQVYFHVTKGLENSDNLLLSGIRLLE